MTTNLDCLVDNPVPKEAVPVYPSFEYRNGTGSEYTHYLVPASDREPIRIDRRIADIGEELRDSDLKLMTNVAKNIEYRMKRRLLLDQNPALRQIELKNCQSSILYFINTYCWTFDPRLDTPHVPFVTYPFQDDLLTWWVWCIKFNEDCIVEKSRDMGLTWCMAVKNVWLAVFHGGTVNYQLSMREEDVDNRTINSLIGKTRYILSKLPEWMRAGWIENATGIDHKMKIHFPDNESIILGQLTGGTIGRGGRATVADFDEFAHVDGSEAVLEAASSLAGSCNFFSTVKGMGNAFAVMAHSPGVRKKTIHWSMHPLKSEEWAIKERNKPKYADESVWAQEHEISYEKSTKGRVYYDFITTPHKPGSWSHAQSGDYYEYDPNFDVYVGMDLGIGDPTSIVFAQKKPSHLDFRSFSEEVFVIFNFIEDVNKTPDDWCDILEQLTNDHGYRYMPIVMDPRSAIQRGRDLSTWKDDFEKRGFPVKLKLNNEEKPINEVHKMLKVPGKFAINKNNCNYVVTGFQNWKYPTDPHTGQVPANAKADHGPYSHCMKAVCYLIDYVYGQPAGRKAEQIKKAVWDFREFRSKRLI